MISWEELQNQMRRAHVREEDLEEHFIRSMGQGGQNVNKVATCVQLTHRPTGITVKCQQERSQAMNRLAARRLLLKKILQQRREREQARIALQEKQRRRNRRRSQKGKELMLDQKRRHSEKKQQRRNIKEEY